MTVQGAQQSTTTTTRNATPQTSPSLEAAASGNYIKQGQSGDAVRQIQEALRARGVDVEANGRFDANTDRAVRQFQRDANISVDGLVGPQTLGALGLRGTQQTQQQQTPAPSPPVDVIDTGPRTPAQRPATPAAPPLPPAAPAAPTSTPSTTSLNLPPRQAGAMTGSQFLAATQGMSRAQREEFIQQQILAGNVPDGMRQMREIPVTTTGRDGQTHTGTLRVMPDYLAIGSNDDFVRVPMSPVTAQRIADQTGTSLPTRKIVNDVYQNADRRLTPSPMTPGAQMMSSDYYGRHQRTIEQQRGNAPLDGELTAGHKKDVVLSNGLANHPDRVAIYGWHQQNGRPIQPLSTVHEASYADYSHGVRLVGGSMIVDGQERPISEVMRDPNLASLVSDEGAMRVTRQPGA